MTGEALVCRLKNLEEIEDADSLLKANMYGETVIISKDHEEGELGLLFDCDTQLSHEFVHHNNLYRHSELNKDQKQQGYFDDNRRVRPIRLRGVKCSGFWMPIESLHNITGEGKQDIPDEGTQITKYDGVKICQKYIKKSNKNQHSGDNKKKKKASLADLVPTFYEHFKTDHFLRNPNAIQIEDTVIITEKLHGTSCRCGLLPAKNKHGKVLTWLFKLLRIKISEEFKFVVGSRRVVKSLDGKPREGVNHYYNEDLWSKASNEHFKGKLNKGETVYFEIVGYTATGRPIMGIHSNSKLKKFMSNEEYKEFIDRYGERTIFTYGCTPPGEEGSDYRIFVYRITQQTPDGDTIDYSWDQVVKRCEELDVNHVPELHRSMAMEWTDYSKDKEGETFIADQRAENYEMIVNNLTNDESKQFPQHIREGVCIRVENGKMTPDIYKHKGYNFKVLEGIIKDKDDYQDIEENN